MSLILNWLLRIPVDVWAWLRYRHRQKYPAHVLDLGDRTWVTFWVNGHTVQIQIDRSRTGNTVLLNPSEIKKVYE